MLAAGAGNRFGSDKRLSRLGASERTVLEQTLRVYVSAFETVTAVLRADEAQHTQIAARAGARVVIAQDAADGMGHSLAAGVRAIRETDCDWLFVGLADMPFVQTATLQKLADATSRAGEDAILRPCWGKPAEARWGHPIGWGRSYFSELESLRGDRGARGLLQAHRDRVVGVAVDDPGVVLDIDTPEDLATSGGEYSD